MSAGYDDLLVRLSEFAAEQERRRPIPARLHVGELAWSRMKARAEPSDTSLVPVLSQMYGVPVVVGSLNTALPLDPSGWRLLDRDGNVISEGVLGD